MKRVISLLPAGFLLFFSTCQAQLNMRSEFGLQPNGLIYSDSDMSILRFMVDSLNLKFKQCGLQHRYQAFPQVYASYCRFVSKKNDLLEVKKDIESGKPYAAVVEKYGKYLESSNPHKLLVRIEGSGEETYFLSGDLAEGYERANVENLETLKYPGDWAISYEGKDEYTDYYEIRAWYLPTVFSVRPIPDQYARLVQYVDCMIDTSQVLMLGTIQYDTRDTFPEELKRLGEYLDQKLGLQISEDDMEYEFIPKDSIKYAVRSLRSDTAFQSILTDAFGYCLRDSVGYPVMEELADQLGNKKLELALMRRRVVIGRCSQDPSPRYHALNIALLAAETHSWDVFLRAHLDIMNDRFERITDGSYAWEGRKTYLKELEELQLNVVDLMIGLALQSPSAPQNHYYGTIWRLGMAMTESKERLLYEDRARSIMQDTSLDDLNRGLIYMMYLSYLYHLPDKAEMISKLQDLKAKENQYPQDIAAAISKIKIPQIKKSTP